MSEKILIDTGPSERGWHAEVERRVDAIVGTGTLEPAELLKMIHAAYRHWAEVPLLPNTYRLALSNGGWALVDADDYERLAPYTWTRQRMKGGRELALRRVGPKTIFLHQEVLGVRANRVVDHINGDALDNRKANLRHATVQQNSANMRLRSTNKSGFKGVSWDTKKQS